MRILDDQEWPFYDPRIDQCIDNMRIARGADDGLESVLDVDASLRMMPRTAMLTVTQSVSIVHSIGETLKRIEIIAPEIQHDSVAFAAIRDIEEDLHCLHQLYLDVLKKDSGTLLVDAAA